MNRPAIASLSLALAFCFAPVSRADVELPVSGGATIHPAGPRTSRTGQTFLYVEGKNNGRESVYASFGVLEFKPTKPDKPLTKVTGLDLSLTQNIARFSRDGGIKIWLAPESKEAIDKGASPLKFDVKIGGGVGEQLGKLHELGTATFAKKETGQAETIALKLDDETEALLRGRLNEGKPFRLVLSPTDDDVAATYFGPEAEEAKSRPKLTVQTGS